MTNDSATVPVPHPDIRFDIEFLRFIQLFEQHHRKLEIVLCSDADNIPAFNNGIVYLLDRDDFNLFLTDIEINALELVGNKIIETAHRVIVGNKKTGASQFNYSNKNGVRNFDFHFYGTRILITNRGQAHWFQQYYIRIFKA